MGVAIGYLQVPSQQPEVNIEFYGTLQLFVERAHYIGQNFTLIGARIIYDAPLSIGRRNAAGAGIRGKIDESTQIAQVAVNQIINNGISTPPGLYL